MSKEATGISTLRATLSDYVLVANAFPSFAIPIFRSGVDSNELLIQRTEKAEQVIGVELFDPLGAQLHQIVYTSSTIVGDDCIYVFVDADGAPIAGPRIELAHQLHKQFERLADFPLLALDVAEFCGMKEEIFTCRQNAFEKLQHDYSLVTAEVWRDQSILPPIFRKHPT